MNRGENDLLDEAYKRLAIETGRMDRLVVIVSLACFAVWVILQ